MKKSAYIEPTSLSKHRDTLVVTSSVLIISISLFGVIFGLYYGFYDIRGNHRNDLKADQDALPVPPPIGPYSTPEPVLAAYFAPFVGPNPQLLPPQFRSCVALSHIAPSVVASVLELAYSELNSTGVLYDLTSRTGLYSYWTAHLKSAIVFPLWIKQGVSVTQCSDIRGIFLNNRFVLNSGPDSILMASSSQNGTGPVDKTAGFWPGTDLTRVRPAICGPTDCCLPSPRFVDPQGSYESSWAMAALWLQRLCAPVLSPVCNSGYSCEVANPTFLCSCTTVNRNHGTNPALFSGLGVDCTPLLPGGVYYGNFDMYESLGYAIQRYYLRTGSCSRIEAVGDLDARFFSLCDNSDGNCTMFRSPDVKMDFTFFSNSAQY
eukprot:Sdes_comp20194_c1_seq1m13483